jgi:hypothetical protein
MNNITTVQYKTHANNIVGTWYNETSDEVLVFSFLYNYAQTSDLLISGEARRAETTYSIKKERNGDWILLVWDEQENKTAFYHIEVLSPDILVLTTQEYELKVYMRKIDYGFVHSILEKLS